MKHRHTSDGRRRARRGLCPVASRLLIAGEILLLLAVCDFAARLNIAALAGSEGALLRLSDFGGAFSSAAVILCASALGLDRYERGSDDA